MGFTKRSRERSRLQSEFKTHMSDLDEVREDTERLSDSAQGITFKLDPKASPQKRAQVVNDIMMKGGRITKAIDEQGNMVQGRFAAMMLGSTDNLLGIGLMYFSMEFGELEMEAVKTRAKLIALQRKVGIVEIEKIDMPTREPNNLLSPIGTAETWEEVVAKAKKLYETGCIHAFAAVSPYEIRDGLFATSPLGEPQLEMLPELVNQLYPDFERIKMYINELRAPDGTIKKQLVAVYLTADQDL